MNLEDRVRIARSEVDDLFSGEPVPLASRVRIRSRRRRALQAGAGALAVVAVALSVTALVNDRDRGEGIVVVPPGVTTDTIAEPTRTATTTTTPPATTTSPPTTTTPSTTTPSTTRRPPATTETASPPVSPPTVDPQQSEFPPDRHDLVHGAGAWAVVLGVAHVQPGEPLGSNPTLGEAVAAAARAGYATGPTDCDRGAKTAWGIDESAVDFYSVSVYFDSEALARRARDAFVAAGHDAAIVAEVATYCLD
jgi:hypothetical protein